MTQSSNNIAHAFWESEKTGFVILSKDWNIDADLPPIFLRDGNHPFSKLERVSPKEAGRFYRYYRNKDHWIFTLQAERYPQLQNKKNKAYLAGEFNGWAEAIGQPQWQLKAVPGGDEAIYRLKVPLSLLNPKTCQKFKFVVDSGQWLDVPDNSPNIQVSSDGVRNFEFNPAQTGQHIFRFSIAEHHKLTGKEKVVWRDASGDEVRELPQTQFLLLADTDLRLGAVVEGRRTIFRLFAPRADGVRLAYGQKADASDERFLDLKRVDSSTWEVVVQQNLDGWFYSYRIEGNTREGTTHFDGGFPVLDPYAKACVSHRGPGIIVSEQRLKAAKSGFQVPAWHDLVILEAHVRDLASHAPIKLKPEERRGYSGLRKWLKAEGSYIKEIGVNAVELQPIQEFDNRTPEEYHWGYMTVNYFSPESSYALEPEKASQIEEFKGLVEDFHDEGIAVILDVVYNHVGEPNHLLFIDKYYYFHVDKRNDLVNWSGCGNDFRCDTPMGRKLIIDSLKHLVEVYGVDGFRFDLAELIGTEVLREIETELKAIKPSLILIAEPWSFRGHIQNELKETGYASWNDGFRDSIAKYVKGQGNQDLARYFLSGSPNSSRFAAQTINYTESHDDHCWMDRITERRKYDGFDPTVLDRRRTHLMAAFLFASIGVPMLAEGQDFLRSKRGVSNTYQRGDLNALDYNRRYVFSGTHAYFRSWIKFRLSPEGRALRFNGALTEEYLRFFFTEGTSATVAYYNADKSIDAPALIFAINPHFEYASIKCEAIQSLELLQIADQERFDISGIKSARIPIDSDGFHLPPLTCGLWLVK